LKRIFFVNNPATQQSKASSVADWVFKRTGEAIPADLYAETLSTAEAISTAARATVLIPDLWPESDLEMLFIPPVDGPEGPATRASYTGRLNRDVMRVIGRAIRAEFQASGTDMMKLQLDSGAEVYVHIPEVRQILCVATGVTLLD
jgi:hypothetical protein